MAAPVARVTVLRLVVPSRKVTVPVGVPAEPETLAERVMAVPAVAVEGEMVRATEEAALVMVTVWGVEVMGLKVVSPE